jgi:RNA polymerase sigma-70 factor (ECF subfamily)
VFLLAEMEGFTAVEIAESLDVGVNTVYSRLRLARRDVDQALRRLRARADWTTP